MVRKKISRNKKKWPRTQDLKKLFSVKNNNTAFSISGNQTKFNLLFKKICIARAGLKTIGSPAKLKLVLSINGIPVCL